MTRFLVLSVIALVLGSCGGHHGSAVPEDAPFISNLSITALTPLVEGQRGVYQFQADFFDPDGDLDGGACAIDTSIGSAALPLSLAAGTGPVATSGTVVCVFETIVVGRVVTGSFTVSDRDGLVSNAIGFTLPAERPKNARR
jgi:hypothetical protein